MSDPRRPGEAALAWMLVCGALAVFISRWSSGGHGLAADQAESLALARGLVEGWGPRLTPYSSTSMGPPNLLWLAVQWVLLRLGVAVDVWLPRVSVVLGALALVLVGVRGSLVWKRPLRVEDTIPVWALALVAAWGEAVSLGSGAISWSCALAACAIWLGRAMSSGRPVSTGLVLGALCLVRPGAVWLLVAAVPSWWIAARLEARRALGEVLRLFAAGALVVVGVAVARLALFGTMTWEGLVPSDVGAERTLEFLSRQAGWFWAALGATMLAAVWRRFHLRGGGTVLLWVPVTVMLATWSEQPRSLFLGCLVLLAILVGDGLAAARERSVQERSEPELARLAWGGLVALALVTAFAARASYVLGPIMAVQPPAQPLDAVDAEMRRRGLQQPLVVWTDAAEAAALFPAARVIVARTPDAVLEDLVVSEGPPDVVDARLSLERMPRLAQTVAPGPGAVLWLSEQSADDDPRCPEGRLALLSNQGEQLLVALEQDVAAGELQRALSRWRCALSALPQTSLPQLAGRRAAANRWAEQSARLESAGAMESALRLAALAATVSGEDVALRGRAERLRAAWFRLR